MHGYLESPSYLPLPVDRPITFKVRLQGTHDVQLTVGDQSWLSLEPVDGEENAFQLTTSIPPGHQVRLHAKLAPGASSYATLIDFTPNQE